MSSAARVIAVVAAMCLAVVVAPMGDLQGQAPESGRGYPSQDWPLVGGNRSGTRYSTLAEITTDTVARLGGAWVTRLAGAATSRRPGRNATHR